MTSKNNKRTREDVVMEDATQGRRDIIVVWGSTGSGKSTLANRFLGAQYDINGNPISSRKEGFSVSASAESMTRETIMKSGYWFGDQHYGEVTLIDTPGLGDSAGPGQDSKNIAQMITFLKSIKPGINLFLLVFSSANPRFDNNLQELVVLFDKMFHSSIWNNVALCFTNYAQDNKSRRTRATQHKITEGTADEKDLKVQKKIEGEFVAFIAKILGNTGNLPKIPCVFVDSNPDEDDDETVKAILAAQFRLVPRFAGSRDPYSCADMKLVQRQTEVLTNQLKEMDVEKTRVTKDLEHAQQEANKKAKALEHAQEEAQKKEKEREEMKKHITQLTAERERERKKLAEAEEKEKKKNEQARKEEEERKAKERSLQIDIKNNNISKQYQEKWQSAKLTVVNSTNVELTNIFYRVVHINNSMVEKTIAAIFTVGISLINATEDASSHKRYNSCPEYFAFQEFQISKLAPKESFTCAQALEFIPFTNIGNHYHFVSVVRHGQTKATLKNNIVCLRAGDACGEIRLIFQDECVYIHCATENYRAALL